jgi:phage gpG-like protein
MDEAKFFKMLQRGIDEAAKQTVANELRRLAFDFKDDLTQAVRQKRYSMQDLSDRWKKKKKKEGLDPRKLIASGKYLENIRVEKYRNTGWKVEPTPFRVKKYKFQKEAPKITYQKLAAIHEFGYPKANIPARPHWIPTIEQYQAQAGRIGKQVQDTFAKRLDRFVIRNM